MADTPDPERLQATSAWRDLTSALGIRTPRKLANVKAATKAIRARPKGARKG